MVINSKLKNLILCTAPLIYLNLIRQVRKKNCESCKKEFSTLFRVTYQMPKKWVFLCENCLLIVKKDNTNYRYGGTWKK